jgi:predicted amidohydrolase/ribosomal protein S18 acetylase RimI-like enzyme
MSKKTDPPSPPKTKTSQKIIIRNWTEEDLPKVVQCQRAAYPELLGTDDDYDVRKYRLQLEAFPEGQFLAELQGQIVGFATTLILQLDNVTGDYRYDELTGAGTFSTHNPAGDTLYGADIAVHPDFQKRGVSKRLYTARLRLLRRYNLRRMLAYGRLPHYEQYISLYTPEEYIEKVVAGEVQDPALNAHLSAGYVVKRLLFDYVSDEKSMGICTVLEYTNPKYKPNRRKVATAAPLQRLIRKARVCTAQYLLRDHIQTWEAFERTTEFFVEAADTHLGHFLVLPEMFTAQLLNLIPRELTELEQIRHMAETYTKPYQELFSNMAQRYGLYIIGGSHPVLRNGHIYNVAHLFTPTGGIHTQDKLHPTPYERQAWQMKPGQGLSLFETPFGRIAIQICYDVEFPEVTRLLALAGVEILFVPYSTTDRMGHNRVSHCARARAIENGIYVVTSGNVGTIHNRGYLLNYAESAIYTPSDFGFPPHAEAGRADPNVETMIVGDLDLGSLAQLRETGSTRPLFERRRDLYEVKSHLSIKQVVI